MKNALKLSLLIGAFTLGIDSVSAACDYAEKAELNREVANVKIRYEALQEEQDETKASCADADVFGNCLSFSMTDYFDVKILNLNEKFYVKLTDSINEKTKTYYYSDVSDDGILHIRWDDLYNVTKLTLEVFSSDKTNCPRERLSVMYQTLPRINDYSTYIGCEDVPDYYLCSKFVTYKEDGNYLAFVDKVNSEIKQREEKKAEEEKGFWEKLLDFIKANKVVIIVCVAVIIVVAGGAVYVIRKRRDL